jgi:hypothetical protein
MRSLPLAVSLLLLLLGAAAAQDSNPAKAEAELKAVRAQIDKVKAEMDRDAGRRDKLAREIEESVSSHPMVAEVAVVGVADALKGQVAWAFVVVRDANAVADDAGKLRLEGDIMKTVDQQLGAVARPSRVRFVTALPKTRSGKLLRRAIQAVCEQRDPGDLTTIEDPSALQQIRDLL